MVDLPPSLVYYGSYPGVMQILKQQSLPLFQADELRDPFLANEFSELNFDCQDLFECTVKTMTASILGKSVPKGNPNHPLQKAIRRWRGENRFNDESEIRESLIGLLPAMVEQSHNHAKEIQSEWQKFVESKRLLPFFENANDPALWLLEAERYSGVAVKFKCLEDSIFDRCLPVYYSRKPARPININDCVDLMVGDSQEIAIDYMQQLLTQNYQFRQQKEWRMVVDKTSENEFYLKFPCELLQSIHIGAAVPRQKAEQLSVVAKQLGNNISIYQAVCSENSYDFQLVKQ